MSAEVRLEGKDWFTEDAAAAYCGVSPAQFRAGYRSLGIKPRRFLGRKLYSRADLFQAIASSPEWQPSTDADPPGISAGPKAAINTGDRSARLKPVRLREYAARKQPS